MIMINRIGSLPVRRGRAGRCCTPLFRCNSFLLLVVFWLGFFVERPSAYGTMVDGQHLHPANQYLRDNDDVPPEVSREVDAGGALLRRDDDDDDETLVSGSCWRKVE
jgi:hypothetical protein